MDDVEIKVAELLYDTLKDDTDVSAVIGTRIGPLVAFEGTAYPFAVYRINDVTGVTKDAGETFEVFVILVFEGIQDYKACLQLKSKVKKALDPTPFLFQESDVDFDSDSLNVVCVMRYTIINN